ncbi:glycoside hydrolase family 16 protein [Mycena floridula]|nr:glycoside hydrolase family 16 protein [Mycena floridula]
MIFKLFRLILYCGLVVVSKHIPHDLIAKRQSVASKPFYELIDMYQGKSFLDDWHFFTSADPTHGSVNYLSRQEAVDKGLARVHQNAFIMAVDDIDLPSCRDKQGFTFTSVRISSKKKYNGGLFIADFQQAPFGCSVWPAWWSVGPSWPAGGEIDVLEGVNLGQNHNKMTLHTSAGCSLDRSARMTGKVVTTTCKSSGTNNNGCGVQDTDPRTFGRGFNQAGGGVFAHLWDHTGIQIWHFARDEIPADIIKKKPDPTNWPRPAAFFSSSKCDIRAHFHDHVLTLNIALCGDWAGATYTQGGQCPGTCASAVADPSNFSNAKFVVNYIAVYA